MNARALDGSRLLKWYPPRWRGRYGEEMVALMEDVLDGQAPSRRLRLSLVWAGLRERGHEAGLLGKTAPAVERRAGRAHSWCCAPGQCSWWPGSASRRSPSISARSFRRGTLPCPMAASTRSMWWRSSGDSWWFVARASRYRVPSVLARWRLAFDTSPRVAGGGVDRCIHRCGCRTPRLG